MKLILTILFTTLTLFAETVDTTKVIEESNETSSLLSFGMIFFGLLTFIPYIYLTIKEKSKKSQS
ncbi:MAG: hypothetical protein OCC49_03515 [Fibrobacterales bacterium]